VTSTDAPILLSGATGFIGRHLVTHLLDAGYRVRALVRPASAHRANLDRRCEIHTGELSDAAALARALSGVGGVVYGAGSVRGRRLADFLPANEAGIAAMLEALERIERVHPAATGGARGGLPPSVGPRVVLLSSLAASRPELSDYARSKRRGEEVLERARGRDWTILRPPAVYGPGDKEMRPLFDLVRRGIALRPGPAGQRLALLHVSDLVRAVAACLETPGRACWQRCFSLHDGKADGYGWAEIAAAVTSRRVREVGVPPALLRTVASANRLAATVFGYAPMLTPGKVRELQQPRWLCDNHAFTEATGWQPQIDLERGAADLFQ
jgi:2-alkyl-3-oxoalkanoate reductase